jgi:NADH:ubiquinone oxidoreductase subunit 6 (subunit J)
VSLAFFALGAFYVAVFNLTVFSGAVVIMFLTMMNLEAPDNEQEEVVQ